MPCCGLAKKAIEVFERAKPSDGLILSKHGIVTFGEGAREAYERMIEMVSLAEGFIARQAKSVAAAPAVSGHGTILGTTLGATLAAVAPIVRGVCNLPDPQIEGAWRRQVAEFRSSDAIRNFIGAKDLARLSESGVITPDH